MTETTETQLVGAAQIAALIRATKDGSYIATLDQAATLIENYGQVAAAVAAINATEAAYDRVDAVLGRLVK